MPTQYTILVLIISAIAIALSNLSKNGRTIILIVCATILMVIGQITGKFSLNAAFISINISVLVIVTVLELFSEAANKHGIMDWIAAGMIKKVKSPIGIYILLLLLTFFISTLMNNLATIVVITPIAISLGVILNFNMQKMIPLLVIASNLGGASTKIGDFPNIIISQQANASFFDFIWNLGIPITLLILPAVLAFDYRTLAKLKNTSKDPLVLYKTDDYCRKYASIRPGLSNLREKLFVLLPFCLFLMLVIVFPTLDASLSALISVSLMLFLMAYLEKSSDGDGILFKIPISSLAFFASIYIIVGAINTTELFPYIIAVLQRFALDNHIIFAVSFMLIAYALTAIFSAGPTAALLLEVAVHFEAVLGGNMIYWILSLGVLAGSSAAITSATAGPVAASLYYRFTNKALSSKEYLKTSLPVSIIILFVAIVYIIMRLLFLV